MHTPNATFSILERIDVGETSLCEELHRRGVETFSILERIDVGETCIAGRATSGGYTFSTLERIDVGETFVLRASGPASAHFQYPRTDRRG